MHSYLVQMGRIDVFKGAFNDLMNFASELDLILVLVMGDEEFINFFVSQESNRTLINDLHCVAVRLEEGTPLYSIFLSIYKQVCATGVTLIGKNGLPLATVDLRNYTSKEAFQQAVEEKATRFSGLTGSSAALFIQDEIGVDEIQEAEEEVSGDSYAGIDDARVDTVSGSRSNEEFQDSNLGSLASYSDRVERNNLDVNRVRSDENSLEDSLFEEESFIGSEDNGNGSSSSENFKMTDGELLSENLSSENERSSISSCSGSDLQPPSNNMSDRVNYENPLPSTSSKCSNTNNQNTSSVNRDFASSNEVSLQVRTPNGTRHTEDFKKTDTLGCVKRRLEQKLKLRHFRIASPVKQSTGTSVCNQFFEEEDYDRTLEELQLCPTAVIIIMPISSEPPFIMNGISRISSFFWYLVMPVLSIVNYFKSLVFGGARGSDGQTVGSSSSSYQPPPPPPTNGPRPNQMRRRRTNKEGGNVHTLRSTSGEDNDSNTYNGNSTQQMP